MARCLSPKLDCLSTICGSPGYMAPEIITQQPYDEKVDIWSLGTICFALLGGYKYVVVMVEVVGPFLLTTHSQPTSNPTPTQSRNSPWDDRSTAMVFAKIKRGKYRFDGAAFQVRYLFVDIRAVHTYTRMAPF